MMKDWCIDIFHAEVLSQHSNQNVCTSQITNLEAIKCDQEITVKPGNHKFIEYIFVANGRLLIRPGPERIKWDRFSDNKAKYTE
ncbi:hypothetical protein CHS0354_017489 [Potamilus streckersoni]|uniref:Uncharacterized protein n=1 Tax=Potamilus streckersoni TaxID=2493646 RepID=A0AAE0SYA1_9BIVA|nr:hypothetical protein CHS0354_017489 [Potamilus streckersoni]